ncbi:MAG: hypothetical protein SGJ10_07320 [Bacteroidota bacterium]|nr:hypothetical protein [Bacteroidota bacterium]
MKKLTIILLFGCFLNFNSHAQKTYSPEKYGKTLNLGLGIGYYGYTNHSMPVLHLNYEFDVARNFTLAPFISFYTYQQNYYWGNPNKPHQYYLYRETVIPVGIKGSYYFDQLLQAGADWDFYLAGSLGVAIRKVTWQNGYEGNKYLSNSPLFLSLHLGAEYHINRRVGLFLDLSTGASTVGLAIH